MRIGILTFHCAYNYGAVLQCYALQEFLTQRGHDVRVIDYRPKAITDAYKWCKKEKFIRKNLYAAAKELILLPWKKKRNEMFQNFINSKLNLVPVETITKKPFDVIIVGSDQVWNFNLTNGFDDYYWGNFPHPKSTFIISYAASMQDSWPNEMSIRIKRNLGNFSQISVRETSLATKLKEVSGGRNIYQVVDPTLLLNREDWDALAKVPQVAKPYLLLFQVETQNEKAERIAKEMAKRKNLPIVRLSTLVSWKTSHMVMSTSPEEFVGLFKNASFVVCSSFHGTVFSLIFNRPFVSVRMGVGKDNRVDNLLCQLGLSEHFVDVLNTDSDYTYNSVSEGLEALKENSVDYITNIDKERRIQVCYD